MFKIIDKIKIEYDYKKASEVALVFLHGFGGNLKNFENLVNKFYSFGYSTLNINLTDYGFKNLDKNFTIYSYANIIFKLIESLKIKNAILIGHSFGGRICIILSSIYKNMGISFKKLVLVDSAGIKPKFSLIKSYKIFKYKFCKFLVNKKLLNKNVLSNFGSTDYKGLNVNLKQVFINVVNEDLTYLLCKIKAKTLIIFGKHDKDTPLYMAKILNKKIKNSSLKILNAGHYSYLDCYNQFLYLLKTFII